MKKNKVKAPIVFYVAVGLLCATLFSTCLSGGFFARYVTQVSGSDTGRVARYDVTVTDLSSKSLTLDSYKSGFLYAESQFSVISESEVSVKYSLTVTLEEPFPTEYVRDESGKLSEEPVPYIFVKLRAEEDVNRENMKEPDVISQDGCVFTFKDIGSFAPGENTANHYLVFEIVPGNHGQDFEIEGIRVRVDVEQID